MFSVSREKVRFLVTAAFVVGPLKLGHTRGSWSFLRTGVPELELGNEGRVLPHRWVEPKRSEVSLMVVGCFDPVGNHAAPMAGLISSVGFK